MNTGVMVESESEIHVDAIQEIRLRIWARKNYVPVSERGDDLHPVILDEMGRIDNESDL
ncbi:MAG: hypothetical protein Tsb009_34400 [Planctomycetaceae bacterium]